MEKLDLTVSKVLFPELSVVYIAMCCIFLCLFFFWYVLNVAWYILNINKITFKDISNTRLPHWRKSGGQKSWVNKSVSSLNWALFFSCCSLTPTPFLIYTNHFSLPRLSLPAFLSNYIFHYRLEEKYFHASIWRLLMRAKRLHFLQTPPFIYKDNATYMRGHSRWLGIYYTIFCAHGIHITLFNPPSSLKCRY